MAEELIEAYINDKKAKSEDMAMKFLLSNGKYLPKSRIAILKNKLMSIEDDEKWAAINSIEYKNPTLITVMSVLFGVLGIDRFLLGDIPIGLLKLLTGGICFVFALVDIFLVGAKAKELNFNELMMLL